MKWYAFQAPARTCYFTLMFKICPRKVDVQLSTSLDIIFGCLHHVERTEPEVCINLLHGQLLMAWLTEEELVKIKIGKLMTRMF